MRLALVKKRDGIEQDPNAEDTTAVAEPMSRRSWNLPFLGKASKKTEIDPEDASTAVRVQTLSSTAHASWLRRGAGIGLAACLVCGPVGVYMAMRPEPQAPASAATSDLTADTLSQRDRAGAFAENLVTKWLTTTRDTQDGLTPYVSTDVSTEFGKAALEVAHPTVVSVDQADNGLWESTVAIDVKTAVPGVDGGDPTSEWITRYYTVPVDVVGENIMAVSAPSLVPAPSMGTDTTVSYGNELDLSGAITMRLQQFFDAYLTGNGDTTVLTSPGTEIAPISPAPYTQAVITEVSATDLEAESPGTGATNTLLVTLTARTAEDIAVPLQYSMTVQSRDSRWEIKDLTHTPQTNITTEQPTEKPTSSAATATTPEREEQ